MSDYYDREGKPLTHEQWRDIIEARSMYKIVALTHIGKIRVSTVWLGLDHNFTGTGPPIIFETMVFNDKKNAKETILKEERYATEKAALKGHLKYVRKYFRAWS